MEIGFFARNAPTWQTPFTESFPRWRARAIFETRHPALEWPNGLFRLKYIRIFGKLFHQLYQAPEKGVIKRFRSLRI
jgi:hypothetical protein